ncbi:MAG: ECF transporter S component [Candidatus Coproplasma sp.]
MQENLETTQEVVPSDVTEVENGSAKKKDRRAAFKNYFTATRISYIAVFTALSYVLYLFDFSLMPGTPVSFLKLDFSNVFVMIGGFALGPVAGVIIGVLKELIHALTVGNTAFIGELANILFILPYMLIPAIIYKKHKGIKTVILSLLLGCAAQCIVSMPVNYFLNFPAFYLAFGGTWEGGQELFLQVWYWALLFNLIKTLIISATVLLIYKPMSRIIKLTNAKFNALKKKNLNRAD